MLFVTYDTVFFSTEFCIRVWTCFVFYMSYTIPYLNKTNGCCRRYLRLHVYRCLLSFFSSIKTICFYSNTTSTNLKSNFVLVTLTFFYFNFVPLLEAVLLESLILSLELVYTNLVWVIHSVVIDVIAISFKCIFLLATFNFLFSYFGVLCYLALEYCLPSLFYTCLL